MKLLGVFFVCLYVLRKYLRQSFPLAFFVIYQICGYVSMCFHVPSIVNNLKQLIRKAVILKLLVRYWQFWVPAKSLKILSSELKMSKYTQTLCAFSRVPRGLKLTWYISGELLLYHLVSVGLPTGRTLGVSQFEEGDVEVSGQSQYSWKITPHRFLGCRCLSLGPGSVWS